MIVFGSPGNLGIPDNYSLRADDVVLAYPEEFDSGITVVELLDVALLEAAGTVCGEVALVSVTVEFPTSVEFPAGVLAV